MSSEALEELLREAVVTVSGSDQKGSGCDTLAYGLGVVMVAPG